MEKTLYELFKMGQEGDEKAKLELYKIFLPRIKKFGRKLFYEEAETDITIFLLEFINKANLEKFQNRTDEEIDSYMYKVFKNKYINILRQNINKNIETTILETDFICYDCYEKLDKEYFFGLMQSLNDIQKKIIIGKYVYDYSDIELSALLKVSRQTIYKHKKKALTILKDEIKKGNIDYERTAV
nr:sigma-70 family RNA polymerase sigma factor [Sedimentibacter sp.]